MVGILAEREDIARTVRSQYRHFVVDEYQDVNPLQQRLLDLWLGERDDVCVVGDPAQTIYSFTGASPRHLLGFPRRYPQAQVVGWCATTAPRRRSSGLANLVLARARPGSAAVRLVTLQAQRPGRPRARAHRRYADDPAEAAAVAAGDRRADRARAPRRPRSRSSSAPTPSPRRSSRRWPSAGIPYLVRGGERFFARKEVREAILLLRGAARGDDGSEPLPRARPRRARRRRLDAERPPASGGAARERWESLPALAALADDLVAAAPEARLPELVRELDERAAAQHAPTVQGVTLASLHAAKGLEWDAVFLVGCTDGLIPITHGRRPGGGRGGAPAALRRRHPGPRELRLSWSGARTPGGRATRAPVPVPRRRGQRPRRGRPLRAQVGRRKAGAGKPAKVATAGAVPQLRRRAGHRRRSARSAAATTARPPTTRRRSRRCATWRLAVAREASVPAYVVFTDATLTAIAEREPSDDRGARHHHRRRRAQARALRRARPSILGGADPREARKRFCRNEIRG